jgi:hypothetical protein
MNFFNLNFFNHNMPIVSLKQSAFQVGDLPGLWRIHWQIGGVTVVSTFYTQHDQACILWSLISLTIFGMAQFLPISWTTQIIFSSALTLVAVIGMLALTRHWVKLENLDWVLYCWIALMLVGLVLTDLSVFVGWGRVLMNLCPLWLGLSAIGYLLTGIRMRSRLILLTGIIHLLTILILPYVGGWQCLTTGIVISGTVLLLAVLQWDANGVCTYQKTFSEHEPLLSIQNSYAGSDLSEDLAQGEAM